ncbi:STAS domain-containing protein [Rhodocyclaceae bacterium SMB388]
MAQQDRDCLVLQGPLTMSTVARHLAEGRSRLERGPLAVDLSAVTEVDSASLALLLDWCRAARRSGHALSLKGVPAGMTSLADLYDLTDLLPVEA